MISVIYGEHYNLIGDGASGEVVFTHNFESMLSGDFAGTAKRVYGWH